MPKKPSALKIARVAAGLSQVELAEKAGFNPRYFSAVESGKVNSGRHFRRAISGALGVNEALLFPAGEQPAAPLE